jgi:hypothetical protein
MLNNVLLATKFLEDWEKPCKNAPFKTKKMKPQPVPNAQVEGILP